MIQLLINDMQGHALRFRFLGLIYFLHHTEQNHTFVKMSMGRCRVEWGVGTKCLWCVVKVGCAMKGRGRFVRDVCGN